MTSWQHRGHIVT